MLLELIHWNYKYSHKNKQMQKCQIIGKIARLINERKKRKFTKHKKLKN